MSMLASLRGGHFNNFAWTSLEHDKAVLAESRTLHGEGGGGSGVAGLEMCVLNIAHCLWCLVTVWSDLGIQKVYYIYLP